MALYTQHVIFYFMFRSFAKLFTPRRLGVLGAFFMVSTGPYWMDQKENERINQKLKKKLN